MSKSGSCILCQLCGEQKSLIGLALTLQSRGPTTSVRAQFLAVINALFFWVPIVLLAVLFPILTALGVAKETTETREAVRLSLP